MLSLLPFIFAYFTKVVAIVFAFYTDLQRSIAFWSSQTSHKPSEAITKYLVLSFISKLKMSGILETPSVFNYKSPNARVTANWPETLPLTITPPSFLV